MPALFAHAGSAAHSKFPPNACRGRAGGVWGRKAPIKPVLSTHSKCRGAVFYKVLSSPDAQYAVCFSVTSRGVMGTAPATPFLTASGYPCA